MKKVVSCTANCDVEEDNPRAVVVGSPLRAGLTIDPLSLSRNLDKLRSVPGFVRELW
jgi:hypothetical protein